MITIKNYSTTSWFAYVLRCSDQTLYTGITNDLEARLKTHNLGKGAKYTRSRLPVSLAYCETCPDRSLALKREYALKQLTKSQKENLVAMQKGTTQQDLLE